MSSSALETRLSRARQELRRILNGPLRDEVAVFDVALDDQSVRGWRQTRLWCHLCARRQLVGRIEQTPAGTSFDLHCPDCWRRYGVSELHYDPHPLLEGIRSFRPAFKRVLQDMAPQALEALRAPVSCPVCGVPTHSRLLSSEAIAHIFPTKGHYPACTYLTFECPSCGQGFISPCAIAGSADPVIRKFMLTRSRWLIERNELTTFQSSQALCTCFVDYESGARVTFFAQPETLEVLATFAE